MTASTTVRAPTPLQHTALYWDLLIGQDEQRVLLQAEYGDPLSLAPALFQQMGRDGAIRILTPTDPSDPTVRR